MDIKTALDRRNRAVAAMRDLYSSARMFHPTSAQINEDKIVLFKRHLAKAPHWADSYVEGYAACLNDQLYRDALVFGIWHNGQFLSTHRNRPDYYETMGFEPSVFSDMMNNGTRGHYWADAPAKPYFIG